DRTAEMVGLKRAIADSDVTLIEGYAYPAYGVPSAETLAAIRLAARLGGMGSDPAYWGKSMQAPIELVQGGRLPAGTRLLYAHRGGVPALSVYSYAFKDG